MQNNIFVKLNLKNIGEVRSLIVDKGISDSVDDRYIMCAGKYDRNGWTIVFKANSYKEAEYIIENTPISIKKEIKQDVVRELPLDISITKKFSYCY
ncbi:MAG: hypothetical protein GX275_12650 [Clostridiales bacterium]|nr:hypothetical protein [Clostridiales bacterium]